MNDYYKESRRKVGSYVQWKEGKLTGMVTSWLGTAFYNTLLKERYGGGHEVTRRRGRRRKQLLDDPQEKGRYWKLKEEALDRILWRTCFS